MERKKKTYRYDAARYLETSENMAQYLAEALRDGDTQLIKTALNNIARAQGMTRIAQETKLSVDYLYHVLSENGDPEFATTCKIINALGMKIAVQPA